MDIGIAENQTQASASFSEETFLQRNGILVTNKRLVVGANMYPMGQISSVQAAPGRSTGGGAALLFVILGAILIVVGINNSAAPIPAIAAAALGVLAIFRAWRVATKGRDLLSAVISTSAGQVAVYSSKDRSIIVDLVVAINRAIISRA